MFFLIGTVVAGGMQTSVMELQKYNWESNVDAGGMFFVKFYAPWCTYCKKLKPVWEALAQKVVDSDLPVKIAEVDCTKNSDICAKMDVQGYPTLLWISEGESKQFQGIRDDIDMLFEFVNTKVEEKGSYNAFTNAFNVIAQNTTEFSIDWSEFLHTALNSLGPFKAQDESNQLRATILNFYFVGISFLVGLCGVMYFYVFPKLDQDSDVEGQLDKKTVSEGENKNVTTSTSSSPPKNVTLGIGSSISATPAVTQNSATQTASSSSSASAATSEATISEATSSASSKEKN